MFDRIRRDHQGIPVGWKTPFLPSITFLRLHVSYYNTDPTMAASNPPQKERGNGFDPRDHKRKKRKYRRRPPPSVSHQHTLRFTPVSRKEGRKKRNERTTLTHCHSLLTRQRSARPRASAQTVPAASPAKAHERPRRDLPAQRSRALPARRWPSRWRARTDSATSFGAGGGGPGCPSLLATGRIPNRTEMWLMP